MKNFFKELIITLLLIAAIILILTVLFYDSIPINKVVPSKVTYTLPETLQEELDKTLDEEQEILVTYKIEEQDLDIYEGNNSYNPGSEDPFGVYEETVEPTTNTGNTSTTPGGTIGTSTTGTGNTTSTGDSGTAGTKTPPVVNK